MTNYDKNIFVIKECIALQDYNTLKDNVINSMFAWMYYSDTILGSQEINYGAADGFIQKGNNPFQFVHIFPAESISNNTFLHPIFNCIVNFFKKDISILRCKANLLTKSNSRKFHWPHIDIDDCNSKVYSAIFYVNSSDGPTYLFKEFFPNKNVSILKKITPEENKMVIFDSRRFHSSSSPVKNDTRIVINTVFKIKEN